MSANYHMYVLRQDRTCQNHDPTFMDIFSESTTHSPGLNTAERDSRILQGQFGHAPFFPIVAHRRNRSACVCLGPPSEAQQFPRADKIRPRPARIIGEPETVHAEDHMRCKNHAARYNTSFSRAPQRMYSFSEGSAICRKPPRPTSLRIGVPTLRGAAKPLRPIPTFTRMIQPPKTARPRVAAAGPFEPRRVLTRRFSIAISDLTMQAGSGQNREENWRQQNLNRV